MAQKLDRSYFGTGNRKTATGTNKKDTSGAAETVQKLNRSHFNKPESAPAAGAFPQKKTAPAAAPTKKQGSLPMDNVGRKNTANSRLLQDIQKREPRDTGNMPSFADRVANTVKGGAKSSAAAYTNVGGVLAEGAGYLNTRIANQNAGAALQSDHDAVKQYEKMLRDVKWADGKPMTAVDVQQVQKYLSAAKRRIAAHEGYTKAVEQSDKEVADKAYRKADELAGSAQADLERAKEGTGFLGNMLVDAGASMTQTGLDAIARVLTGGALGMAPFAVRAFGSATQQARQEKPDSTLTQQVLYGTTSSAKEVISELMFNIAMPFTKAYGGGALDDVVKRGIRSAVDKLAKTEAGKKALGSALTFGAGAVGEGLEEFIGDWMEWQLPRIYGGDVATAQETLSDSLYDFLVGATSGAMGGIVSPNTYRYDLGTAQQGAQERTDVQDGTRTAPTQTNVQAQQEGAQRAIQEAAQRQTVSNPVSMEEQVLRQREAAVQKTFTGIADKLGDSGRKAFQTAYQGTDRGDYAGEFLRAYHAGMTNQKNPNSTSAVSFAAYAAGQNDAAASLAREKRAAQFAKTAGTDSGLVFDDYVSREMDSAVADEVNTVSKALGVRTRMVDQVLGGSANGQITGSDVLIAKDAVDPALQVVGHEWTHRVQELAPEQYRSFRDAVASIPDVQEAANILLDQYNRAGVETSYEQALDEATANYAGEMIANSDVLDDFIRKHSTDRTLLQKLRDAIHEIVGKLTGRAKRQAQTVEGKLQAAFEAASKQAESLQNRQTNGTISETRYAVKEGVDDGRERAQGDGSFAQEAEQNREGNRAVQESAGEILRGDAVLWRGRGGLNASFGQKPVRSWAEGHIVRPSQGSVAYTEQQTAADYGVPSFVVDDAAWAKNKGNAPAFSAGGQIYFRETMPEQNRGMYATHEITHVMKQVGYTPYLDFVSKTPDMLDMSTLEARILLEHTAKHRGIDPLNTSLSETERINLYDELNATLYGHISSGNMGGLNEILNTAFYDFSAYAKELNELHERFKADNQKKAKENTRFSLKTPVEETDKLIAVHNKDEASIMAALKLGGLPMPSIAVVKAKAGHSKYGPISLLFNKTTIDPQADSRNKVYGGDAYTPTNPGVEYPVNAKAALAVEGRINELSKKVANGIFASSSALRSHGIEEVSTDSPIKAAEILARDDAVRAAYLEAHGKELKPVYQDKVWDKYGNDTVQTVLDEIGVQRLAEINANFELGQSVKTALGDDAERLRDILRDYYRDTGEALLQRMAQKRGWTQEEIAEKRNARIEKSMENVSPFTLESLARHAWDYYQDGGATKGEIDRWGTQDRLHEMTDGEDVKGWVEKQLSGVFGEPGINNGKDPYTSSGNRRSFNQTHYSYTLENIVKAMQETQEERGGQVSGVTAGGLQASAVPSYRTIQEIRDDSGRLGSVETDSYKAQMGAVEDKIRAVTQRIMQTTKAHTDNSFEEGEIIGTVLMEAARGKRTIDSIMRTFANEGYKISNVTAKQIQELYKAAAALPTEYFEAKPQRAVGFDEVLAAVIPDNSSDRLKAALQDAGVNTVEYIAGDEADRLAKVNSVDDAKFSLKGTENAQEIAALKRENESLKERVEYWKGQTRRSQGVTTDRKSVQKAADALVKDYGAEISGSDIAGDLQSLYDYIASGKDGRDELTYAEARRRSDAIAERIAESAVEVDDRAYKEYAGLRKYLKDTKLTLTEADAAEITDFNEFRKSLFGKLKINKGEHTNVDQIYSELSSQYPEFFNEAQETNISDQVQRIADVANRLYKVTEYNPFEGYMGQAVASISNDIMDRFFDLPQTKKTFADRAAEQVQEARFQGRQAANDAFLAGQMSQGRQDAKRLRSTAQALAKERTRRAEQVQALKERYREKDVTRRDNQKRRELRAKIVRHASALSQKLLRPTDNQHIPEDMRSAVAKVLESINQESSPNARSFTLDPVTKERIYKEPGTPTNRTVAFQNLKEQYQKIAQDGDMVVDPSLLGGDDVTGGFSEVIKMGDTRLADLTTEQLKTMWNVLKSVEHSVTTAGKTLASEKFATTKQFADALRMDGMTRRRKLGNNVAISLETPYTFFAHFGQTGKDIYRMLRNAQDHQEIMARDVAEKVHQILGDAKTGIRENAVTSMNEEVHHFTTTEGHELDLTTAQAMELYLLSERKQAEDHLLKGGIVQPEIKIPGKTKIPRGTDVIHLSAEDIQSIVKVLTPEQIRIADGLQKLTTGVLANYGNEASMKAYGYKKFTEQDYWPIKSAKETLHSSQEKDSGNVRSIKNIGMAQAVKPNAATPLSIRGVFDTFADHASDMIDYAAWLCPMEDANRLYNFQFRDSEGNLVQTVKGFLEEKGGQGSQQYWQKLMGDIQNGIKTKDFEPLTDKFAKGIGSFKGAAVGANVRVVIQQPSAFFRASAVLDPSDMARGLTGGVTKGNGWEKALTHSPIAMRKDVGSFDISSPYTLNDRFYGKEGITNKINEKAGAPAGKADAVTWGVLWNACEWQVKRERPNLRAGSGEFYSAVNEVFTSMIDQTQVVDGILQRSNIMRGKSDLAKQATSFMGEPIMSLNVFMRAWDNMRYEENPAKRSKAIKTVGRAAAALLVTDVVNALAQSIADAGRDDDPDKDYWEKFLTALTGITGGEKTTKELLQHIVLEGNLGSNINKLGSIPFVKDILSLTQGYSVSRTDMQVFSDIVSASKDFTASMGGSGKKTREEALANMFAACSKLFGLPVANIKRDAMAAVRTAVQATGSVALEYEFEKFTYNIYSTANKSRYLNLAFKALEQGDLTTYEHIRKELKDFMALDNSSVDSSMRSKLDKERENDEDFSLPDAAASLIGAKDRYGTGESEDKFTENDLSSDDYIVYSRKKSELYSSMESGLEDSQVFRAFTDEQKDKALSSAETYAKKTALHETDKTYEITDKWILKAQEAQQKYGIKPEIYVALKTQVSDLESVKDRNGETIPNSKGLLIMQAVYNMPGLSEKQRNALFEYLGVGKSIRHYNKALVNEKVRKNARLAGK
ncbi:MAG: hypothetical protein BHV90_14765 [Clostridiales bacterium 42_27]|jgi:hypothetical protein|nr:MAG: hypothetical protein BHV90_14765 [Clostridiales bacterium 42_27]